ncbi:MAG TPA: hypothetical protein VF501_10065 [Thiobacillus sp.]
MDIVDMMVHVDETVPADRMHELEDVVRTDACVISACTSHDDPHVLMVTYNPACTTSGNVLNMVQAQGIHAELVGL